MKFAGRINSLKNNNENIFVSMEKLKKIKGITHVDLNYPEHLSKLSVLEIKKRMGNLKLNGISTRFKENFINGEFTNPDKKIRQEAIDLCKKAIDVCQELGGNYLTIWCAFDGFDYPFQINYEKNWNLTISALQEICDYSKTVKISFEYKPYEPRAFSILDSVGHVLTAIYDTKRDNIGITLDFCHMVMKKENPAYSLALVAMRNRLYGLHMNDGYGSIDNGLIFGSINFLQALEFVYYLVKYKYEGVVFFDSFPVRENPAKEIEANISMFNKMINIIDYLGIEYIEKILNNQDALEIINMLNKIFK